MDANSAVIVAVLAVFLPVFARAYLVHLSRDVWLWLVSAFFTGFCTLFGGIYGTQMNLYLLKLGHGPQVLGQINGAFWVGMALFALVTAWLVPVLGGVRNAAAVGLGLVALGQVLFPLPTLLGEEPTLTWLSATLMTASVGLTLYAVNIWPFMAARIEPDKRKYGFAGHLCLVPVGGMAGARLSGKLAFWFSDAAQPTPASLALTLLVAGLVLCIGVLALCLIGKEAPEVEGDVPRVVASQREARGAAPVLVIALMVVVMIFDVSGEGIGRVFKNAYMATDLKLDEDFIAILLSYGQLVAALAVFGTPALITRLGLPWTFMLTTLGMSLGLAVISTIPHWAAAGAGYAILIGFSQMAMASKQQYAMEVVAERYRPHIAGFMQFAQTGTVFVLSMVGGQALADGLTYPQLFNLVAVSTAVAAVLFYFFFVRTPRGELAQSAATSAQSAN